MKTMTGAAGSIAAAAMAAGLLLGAPALAADKGGASLKEVVSFPYQMELASAERADRIAWVQVYRGVRNIWVAEGPSWKARQLTRYDKDDGQELTQLTFSPDGSHLVFVRGGAHDQNWPAAGGLQPDPDNSVEEPKIVIWAVDLGDGKLSKVAEGDAPTLSAKGELAYVNNNQVFTAKLDGSGKGERLFFDRGKDGELSWSPDGTRLAFVSDRGDHSFIGVYAGKDHPLTYLSPSTGRDSSPRWSPDGTEIAFMRRPGQGGAPDPILSAAPDPFAIRVSDPRTGQGHEVFASPKTLEGSIPEVAGGINLNWGSGHRLVFTAEFDNWSHLYVVPETGGRPTLLTPGDYMVEHVIMSRDHGSVVFDANTGPEPEDHDRRHLFRVSLDKAAPTELTRGATLEWSPVDAGAHEVAAITAGVRATPTIALVGFDASRRDLGPVNSYPSGDFVTPRSVTWKAPDGQTVHGVLFSKPDGKAKPGVIFVHGGPPRQMLLGWHYMDYYSNAYAMNQYMAAHGFTVLAVNYRLGIGYGRAYQHPEHAGLAGSSEYQDVLSGARFLQSQPGVDPARIGIWGGSYGGLLTALALARNSDVFKAGVDLHGVHDWSVYVAQGGADRLAKVERGDLEAAEKVSLEASPIADIDHWRSPVLLIQGDDDRNVEFHQTVDLARRLEAHNVPVEELVLPNEIHGFLRNASWVEADTATVDFLDRKLGVRP